MKRQQHKKIGLALGSGGIKGIAHVGVLQCLSKHKIPVDYIAGTSIGAWVAGHYAVYKNISLLERYTIGKRLEKLSTFFDLSLKGGLIKGAKVEKLLDEWLGEAFFEDLDIPLAIIAADIITGEEVVFTEGRVSHAVRASIAVPSIFAPYELDETVLIDGGVCNPVPVDIVRDMGADIVVAVNLDNYRLEGLFDREDLSSLARVTTRGIEILRHYLAQKCVGGADVVIEPNNAREDLAKWRNYFTRQTGEEHIKLGYKAAEEKIPEIKKLLKEKPVRKKKNWLHPGAI